MPDLSERLLILTLAAACFAVGRRVRSGMRRYDSNGFDQAPSLCLFDRRLGDHQRKGGLSDNESQMTCLCVSWATGTFTCFHFCYQSERVTTKYCATLGMPFVNTVANAGPFGSCVSGSELKLVSDQPSAGSTGAKATWLLS